MIYVRVELWPGGSQRDRELLTEGYIANDGTGNPEVGNYVVQLMKEERYTPGTWKHGKVKGFARLTKGVWDLIYLALRDTVGDRNK